MSHKYTWRALIFLAAYALSPPIAMRYIKALQRYRTRRMLADDRKRDRTIARVRRILRRAFKQ